MKRKLTKYRCAICERRLAEGDYIYSRHTGNRYCGDDRRHRELVRRKRKTTERMALA